MAIRKLLRLFVLLSIKIHQDLQIDALAKDCSGEHHGKGVNMENNGCLRQQNRHSVSLGGGEKVGLFCRSWYKDGDL
jgi:hypothetical protein